VAKAFVDLIAGRKKKWRKSRNEVGKASGEGDEAEESST
jgi:hypothetical protein